MAGEGEGEAQRQSSTFHSHVVQEVRDAVHNVVKELEGDKFVRDMVSFSMAAGRGDIGNISVQKTKQYLFPCALHDLYGNGVDFVMHLHCSPLSTANLN